MITLTYATNTVTLPADMLWEDEFTWRPVEQKVEYTITGSTIVQTATRQAGRPITLQGGDNYAWITRDQLETMLGWADVPGRQMTLSIRGQNRTVVFRHQDTAIDATMVMYHAAPSAGDFYTATIRLQET